MSLTPADRAHREHLRRWVRRRILSSGIKHAAIAHAAGMGTGHLSMILSGRKGINLTNWCALVDALTDLKAL